MLDLVDPSPPLPTLSNHRVPRTRRASSTNPSLLVEVPSGLSTLLSQIGTEGSLSCEKGGGVGLDTRSGGYQTNGKGKSGTTYCGDRKEAPTRIWWESNMDIDCDGSSKKGPCSNDGTFQGQTAFQDKSGKDIDAQAVPYVVIDQDKDFNPQKFGVEPLSVVAVVCGGKLTFGIWADTNALGSMGEVSVYLAQVCFGSGMNGDAGYDDPNILYVAFPGDKSATVPSEEGKDLNEIMTLGQALVQKAFGGSGGVVSEGTVNSTASARPPGGSQHQASSAKQGEGGASGTATSAASSSGSEENGLATGTVGNAGGALIPTGSSTVAPSSTEASPLLGSVGITTSQLFIAGGCILLLIAVVAAWAALQHGQHGRRYEPARRSGGRSGDSESGSESGPRYKRGDRRRDSSDSDSSTGSTGSGTDEEKPLRESGRRGTRRRRKRDLFA